MGAVSAQRGSPFLPSKREDWVSQVLFCNFGLAVVMIIMEKGSFRFLAKNRVPFSSTIWILIGSGTIKIRNGPRV